MAKKPVKLNIACGQTLEKGWIGMDIVKGKDIKYVGDILDFWSKDNVWSQIPDNSVDEIYCSMFVEHLPHIIEGHGMKWGYDDCFYLFFDQVHRVLKKADATIENPNQATKGFARLVTPYYSSMRAWQDPTHYRAISESSYLYLNKKWREENKLDHYPVKCDFDFYYNYNYAPHLQNRNAEFVSNAVGSQVNAVSDIIVTLLKR